MSGMEAARVLRRLAEERSGAVTKYGPFPTRFVTAPDAVPGIPLAMLFFFIGLRQKAVKEAKDQASMTENLR